MRLALKEVLSVLVEFEILESSDGEQALALIREHQPELVLLYLLMPKLDGFDVT
jgi:CheY-like chemotaxis protein